MSKNNKRLKALSPKDAVENIDAILAVNGVDGVFIGPYDMSGSYGIIGQTAHPVIKEACLKVFVSV
jgi:2-dehydro-3-deoxyglucarate aldolase